MPQNLIRISTRNHVRPLLAELQANMSLWGEITARQKTPGSPHRDTETIFLRWSEDQSLEAVFNELDAIDYPALNSLPSARHLIASIVRDVGGTEIARAMIVNLKPGGFITPHIDEGAYADRYERFHLALKSEVGNRFYVEDSPFFGEFVQMQEGELWWFNHKKNHYAFNESKLSRVHLILDCVAPAFRRERDE